jgi:prepilin peptidase CpaA
MILADLILVVATALLFYAALTDLKSFKIRNEAIVALLALFLLHAVASGRWTHIGWNLGFALLMLAVMLVFYARNWMGGGDVKLLAVAFLWTGLACALPFALLLAVFAGMHAGAASLGWVRAPGREGDARARIAFAPSIAAALIGVFALGCLSGPQ